MSKPDDTLKDTNMNTFVKAVEKEVNATETANGMPALKTSCNANTDLFFKIGAMRGQDITQLLEAAVHENPEYALRIALWVRDIREGAGERDTFRKILGLLSQYRPDLCMRILPKVPELGRWDDLLTTMSNEQCISVAYNLITDGLRQGNELCAKWMPRKGINASKLRKYMKLTPKQYRRLLVAVSNTVETQMCGQHWDTIDYNQVPSLAAHRYGNAFAKHSPERYAKYVKDLEKNDGSAKINAGAIFPHDVIKPILTGYSYNSAVIKAQWAALPNYTNGANILPMVDVSASMKCFAGNKGTTECIDVAISLGVYLAEKNKGLFKNMFMTFDSTPVLTILKGDIVQMVREMKTAPRWMNTDLSKAFERILSIARENEVDRKDMPEMLLILSDMQFDQCTKEPSSKAYTMMQNAYERYGYTIPKIVFWNINAYDNVPVEFTQKGTALVSGFSPSILKALLGAKLEEFTPENVMLETIMSDRYKV